MALSSDRLAPVAEGETERATELAALADVRAVLQLCASGRLRVSEKTSRASAVSVALVAEHLSGGDFYPDQAIAAFAWPLLVQAGGLATGTAGKLSLTAKGRRALGEPPADVIRGLWKRWVTHGLIDEFTRIEHIKGQRTANTLTAAKPRRGVVAQALGDCLGPDWLGVDDLFRVMRRRGLDPAIARSERALWRLYLVDSEYGSLGYAGFGEWSILQGRYTLAVLFEYAATLGLVDVRYTDPAGARTDYHDQWGGEDLDALSRYDGLLAVRRTALGAYATDQSDSYVPSAPPPQPAGVLEVLSNLDVVVTGELNPADRLVLSAYAAQTAERVWTTSAATLLAAVDAGRPLDAYPAFLAERAGHELPAAMTQLVSDVAARAGRLTDLGPLLVVECADAATAVLITRDRGLKRWVRPLGERHLAVDPDREDDLRAALLRLGYALPRRS